MKDGDDFDRFGVAAGPHLGEAAGDDDVVVGGDAAAVEAVDGAGHADAARRAGQVERRRLRHLVAVDERQGLGLGIGEQAVAVHGDAVALAQDQHLLGLRRGLRDRCGRHHLEDLGRRRHRPARPALVVLPTHQHLLAAAPARHQADAALDEARVGLGMRLHGIGMQQDLAAAAERQAGRCGDDGKGRVLHRLQRVLADRDRLLDLLPGGDVRREEREAEVGADREVRALVVDHERLHLRLHELDRLVQEAHDLVVERVRLRGELEAGDAVAEVPQRGRAVLQQRLGGELDVLEQQHALGAHEVVILAVETEELALAVLEPVEGLVSHLLEDLGRRDALVLELARKPRGAELVDELKGAGLPVVAEPHRLIDGDDLVGGFRHQARGIGERAAHHGPGVAADLRRIRHQRARVLLRALQRGDVRRRRGDVLAACQVDRLLVLAALRLVDAVEAALALAAGVAVLDHAAYQRHVAVHGVEGVGLRQQAGEARVDVRPEVDADEVDEAEDAGLRDAEGASHHGVGLFHRQSAVDRVEDAALHPVDAEAVGDEAGRVLAGDDALAHRDVGEAGHLLDQRRVALRAGDDLEQAHVARRVEEVGDHEVALEAVGQALDELGQRDRRGVRRDRRALPAHLVEAAIEALLDVEPLDDDLDDPVAVGDLAEVVLEVADSDELGGALRHEGGGLALQHLGDGAGGDRVAVLGVLRHDVEQQHRHARIRDLRGDAGAHDAGAEDGDFLDLLGVRHHRRSMMVAMPWPPPMHWVASA
jgi:hypothetical protein